MSERERLMGLLSYDPDVGKFYWRSSRGNGSCEGDEAGCVEPKGYVRISCGGKQYLAHRLAWLFMTGNFPSEQVDHINRNKSDNRWDNLRSATHGQNQWNRAVCSRNKSGVKGVYWDSVYEKWKAAFDANGKTVYVGLFDSVEEAAEDLKKAREVAHRDYCLHSSRAILTKHEQEQ